MMIKSDILTIRIEAKKTEQPLSKGQKRFNALSKKIESLKRQLREWQEKLPRIYEKVSTELDPLWDEYNLRRIELVYLFDNAHQNKLFKKRDKEKLSHLICKITAELLAENPQLELKNLHDKHSYVDYDEITQEEKNRLKAMMEDMLGIDMPDELDLNSPDAFEAFMNEKLEEERAQHQEQQRANERQKKRKKTPKQLKREEQEKVAAQEMRKSLQEIYRKLVAALHPDRETDNAERERKTELMQRVNVAYDKKDLLQLLELQLEVEQIGQSHINTLSELHIKHYIKILKEQCDELEQSLNEIQMPLKMQLNFAPHMKLSIKHVTEHLSHDIKEIQRNVSDIQQDLQIFQKPSALKAWLKSYRMTAPHEIDDFDFLSPDELWY